MGEYANVMIKKYCLDWTKNTFNKKRFGHYFSESQLIITDNVECEDDESHTTYVFQSNVGKIKQRLNCLGYSFKRSKEYILDNLYNAFRYEPFLNTTKRLIKILESDQCEDQIRKRLDQHFTFEKYMNSLKKIVHFQMESGTIYRGPFGEMEGKCKLTSEIDKIIYYSQIDDVYDGFYGFDIEKIDPFYIIRLVLETIDEEEEVKMDVTSLLYWEDNPSMFEIDDIMEKAIVLVEGSSDREILDFVFKKEYPHLSDVFHFLDFEDDGGKKREGSCSLIVKNLHAFKMAKMRNNFIGIFDNDAVGKSTWEKIVDGNEIGNIPLNIKILHYPDIKEARNYPTISPTGKLINGNINGKACSIELYLPKFLLMDTNDEFYPIEWNSLINYKINQTKKSAYQGVISNKENIKKNCFNYIDEIKDGTKPYSQNEWENIVSITNVIVETLNE